MREFIDGDFPFANEINALVRDGPDGTYVDSGCSVSDGGTNDMTVDVASGTVYVNDSAISVSAQTVTLNAADSFKRYDLIVVDSTGTASKVTGTQEKVAPSIPTDNALLATIEVPAGAAGVTNENILDGRVLGMAATKLDGQDASDLVPSGLIAIWSGTVTDIPSGWVLCDGNNGTPNLQDKFVVGAGSTYAAGATGGAGTVALTESELASHTHSVTTYNDYTNNSNDPGSSFNTPTVAYETSATGGDSAHENKPPYHALAYIQKV